MKYVMVVMDEFSRYVWLHLILNKCTIASAFRRFVADVTADQMVFSLRCRLLDMIVEWRFRVGVEEDLC